jgi:hypothetical protein
MNGDEFLLKESTNFNASGISRITYINGRRYRSKGRGSRLQLNPGQSGSGNAEMSAMRICDYLGLTIETSRRIMLRNRSALSRLNGQAAFRWLPRASTRSSATEKDDGYASPRRHDTEYHFRENR